MIRRLEKLTEATLLIGAAQTPSGLVRTCAEQAKVVIGAQWAAACLRASDGDPESHEELWVSGQSAEGFGFAQLVALMGVDQHGHIVPLRLSDAEFAARSPWAAGQGQQGVLRGWLAVPLPGTPAPGILAVSSPAAGGFDDDDEALLLQLANAAAATLRALLAQDDMQQIIRSHENFLAMLAHELKNPVTSMRGFIQLMLRQLERGDGVDPARFEKSLKTIDRQSGKLLSLVSDMREATHIYAGQVTLERTPVEVGALLESAASIVQMSADDRLIETHLSDPPDSVWVVVDPFRMRQALTSLLENAVRVSDSSSPITLSFQDDTNGCISILIRCQSLILDEDWRRMLNYLGQPNAMPAFEGVGMGMYIAHRIIELHGGRLHIDILPGGATQFRVVVPGADCGA